MKRRVSGELTVFLSLIFLLLISLMGAVIQSVSVQMSKNERRADAARASESVFAEYQIELLKEYGIFGLDAAYGTGEMSEQNILNRLAYYGTENIRSEVAAIEYLTDHGGMPFFRQAVEFEKEIGGIGIAEDLFRNIPFWNEQQDNVTEFREEDAETRNQLEELLDQEEERLPTENNPLAQVTEMKNKAFLSLVKPSGFQVSDETIDLADTVSYRERNRGYGTFPDKDVTISEPALFRVYLLNRFGRADAPVEGHALSYELEYLLSGKSSDLANLEAVAVKISLIRWGLNYMYLLTDTEKRAEAAALAAAICSVFSVTGISILVERALLFAWAYAEAVADVKCLLAGKKVPFFKTRASWKVSLEGLAESSAEEAVNTAVNKPGGDSGGQSYQEYLFGLLLLESKEKLTERALDLIEQNIRKQTENAAFRMDHCVSAARFAMECPVGMGITYSFETGYIYR